MSKKNKHSAINGRRGGRPHMDDAERLCYLIGIRVNAETKGRFDVANTIEGGGKLTARLRKAMIRELHAYIAEMRREKKITREVQSGLRQLPKQPLGRVS